jgi:hypothetical protein
MRITAKQFYDLVALCFAWRWDPDKLSTTWGTIHAANWLLFHAGAYDSKVRDVFARDNNVASLFSRRNNVYPAQSVNDVADEVWSDDRHFLILVPSTAQFQASRLLSKGGYRLVLSDVGQQYAMSVEGQYAAIITRDRWEAARRERAEFFRRTNASRRAAMEDAVLLRDGREDEGNE